MLNPGTRLGPSEILATAGAGGMGEGYRARDSRLERTGALKLLPPHLGERWQVSTAGGTEPQWRGDGNELYFLAGSTISAVDIKTAGKTVKIGIPHTLFEAKLPQLTQRNRFVPAKDGQKFLVVWQQEQSQTAGFDTIVNWTELLKRK